MRLWADNRGFESFAVAVADPSGVKIAVEWEGMSWLALFLPLGSIILSLKHCLPQSLRVEKGIK